MAKFRKGGLGRGLEALIGGPAVSEPEPEISIEPGALGDERLLQLDPHTVKPNPKQPRRTFSDESLQELAESIKLDGIVEPVVVRSHDGHYELVSGERRVRAAILAGLETVPAVLREVSDSEMLKLGLIENIQREDLNAIETGSAYRALMKEFNWTQEELAHQVGKNRATVANTMRLLNLPQDVQESVAKGLITMGHARAILGIESPKAQSALCRETIERGLSVRQIERLAAPKVKTKKTAATRDPHVAALEDELRHGLGTRVTIHVSAANKSKGKIEIEYYTLDDLDRILAVLRS